MCRGQQNGEGKMGKVSEDKSQEKTSNQCLVSGREGNAGRFSDDGPGDREAGGVFVSLFPLQGGTGGQTLRLPLRWPHKGCAWPGNVVSELAHLFVICFPQHLCAPLFKYCYIYQVYWFKVMTSCTFAVFLILFIYLFVNLFLHFST